MVPSLWHGNSASQWCFTGAGVEEKSECLVKMFFSVSPALRNLIPESSTENTTKFMLKLFVHIEPNTG
jgi:hypothetical protein